MGICQFFLQGRCRFGERCWNEHPRDGRPGPAAVQLRGTSSRAGGSGGGGGGWNTANQRYTNVIQPSAFKSVNAWGGSRDDRKGFFGSSEFGSMGSTSRDPDFSQNRFSALMSSQNIADGSKDEEERLLESIVKDMEMWVSSGQWVFSSYSPMKGKTNISGFLDISPEELRLEYYNCNANNSIQDYIKSVQECVAQWKNRVLQLKTLNAPTRTALLSELKSGVTQPLRTFTFGGQQTSSIGSSTGFPAAAPPASIPPAVGFGTPSAPSAASFSFKTADTANTTTEKLFTPRGELTAEELKQFEAKRFTLGKIPLKPPPIDLLKL